MRIAWFFKEHKVVTGVILVDLLILVVLVVMMIMKAGKTATVDIMTVPSIAKVKIGGGEYSSGAYKVRPGDYDVTVAADGFVTKTVPVSARDGEISKVWVYLVPEEGNLNYYAQHEEDWENMRLLDDEEAQRVYKLLSIQEELPINYAEEINNSEGTGELEYILINKNNMNCEKYYCIRVSMTLDRRDIVEKVLEEKGLKVDDFGVEWKVYTGETTGNDVLMEMREAEWGNF